jgi:Protein of unknown function (DUF3037)/PilZ domain
MSSAPTYEYLLLRYMPNIVLGEFITCAVLLFEQRPSDSTHPFCGVRILQDWSVLERLDENVDVDFVGNIVRDTARRVRAALEDCTGRELGLLLKEIESWSNGVVSTPPTVLVTDDPEASLGELDKVYLRDSRITVTTDAAPRERRKDERIPSHILLEIKTHSRSGERCVGAVCTDIGQGGLAFETEADLDVGDIVELKFSQNDHPFLVQQAKLVYRYGLRYGARFTVSG